MQPGLVFSVSDFVAVVNQTFEFAYYDVAIEGEISALRVSKGKWVYFDLKDSQSSIRCFATVYQVGPGFADGMKVRVQGIPKLHNQYGFSVTVQTIAPVGEGAIKKSFDLLKQKLELEGLFDDSRKRQVPYPPRKIALVASRESAAYGDFIKVLKARFGGITVVSYDTQVQGDSAPESIVQAITVAAQSDADVLVVTRGGGSLDDLAAFNNEAVVRSISASRIPTLVAIGHERDESLAELAADVRASTPSNAAELLVPDRVQVLESLQGLKRYTANLLVGRVEAMRADVRADKTKLVHIMQNLISTERQLLGGVGQLVEALNPRRLLKQGYSITELKGERVIGVAGLREGEIIQTHFIDGSLESVVKKMYTDNKNAKE